MPNILDQRPQLEVKSRAQWRRWLIKNHTQPLGVWVIHYKRSAPGHYIGSASLVEEALCFGWIDSVPRKLDEHRTQLYFGPRRPGSPWSAVNKERIRRMIEDGCMTKHGLAKIAAAKKDGSWKILDGVHERRLTHELKILFAKNKKAKSAFEKFTPSWQRRSLEYIQMAKQPATRAKRAALVARKAAQGKLYYQP